MDKFEQICALREVRAEITRVNEAAGYTVFNPAATQALQALMREVGA
jgi:predicted phage gp36 major capsid-like protein